EYNEVALYHRGLRRRRPRCPHAPKPNRGRRQLRYSIVEVYDGRRIKVLGSLAIKLRFCAKCAHASQRRTDRRLTLSINGAVRGVGREIVAAHAAAQTKSALLPLYF